MAGVVVVRSNFVLDQVDIGDDVVLSTVENLGLDGGVNVALGHALADAAHVVHHVDAGVRADNTDLEALQFVRIGDRAVTGVEVAGAEGVGAEDDKAVLFGGGIQSLEGGIAGLEHALLMIDVIIDIGGGDDGEVRGIGLDDGISDEGHVQSAHHDHLKGLSLVTEGSIGIDLEGVTAFRCIIEIVADLLQGLGFGVGDGLVERDLQDGCADLGVIRESGGAESDDHDEDQEHCDEFLHVCSS